jgi:purine-nucleoside phosphorylase
LSSPNFAHADYAAAADLIRARTTHQPTVGLILGSGLGGLAETIEDATIIPTHDIPGWPPSTVQGHKGRIVIGRLEGAIVCALQGRIHFYEGYPIQQVVLPVRVMQALGIRTLIVTNAAGGLNQGFEAGDLMMISDQINLPGMSGQNPLIGAHDPALGVRFPDMTVPYDTNLRALARRIAQAESIRLREGVYICLSGPAYETPAEIRMLRGWGGDAVGMSTAPEVVVARQAGMRVLGFSGITNIGIDVTDSPRKVLHEDVISVGDAKIVPALTRLLRGVLRELPSVAGS